MGGVGCFKTTTMCAIITVFTSWRQIGQVSETTYHSSQPLAFNRGSIGRTFIRQGVSAVIDRSRPDPTIYLSVFSWCPSSPGATFWANYRLSRVRVLVLLPCKTINWDLR